MLKTCAGDVADAIPPRKTYADSRSTHKKLVKKYVRTILKAATKDQIPELIADMNIKDTEFSVPVSEIGDLFQQLEDIGQRRVLLHLVMAKMVDLFYMVIEFFFS